MIRRSPAIGDISDVVITTVAAGEIYLVLLVVAVIHQGGALFSLSLLSAVAGAALGWVIGIGLSAYQKNERESFASVGKLIGAGRLRRQQARPGIAQPRNLRQRPVDQCRAGSAWCWQPSRSPRP